MKTKDVSIGGSLYRVSKFDATIGAWILSNLVAASAQAKKPDIQSSDKTGPMPDMDKMSEKERDDFAQANVAYMWTLAGTVLDLDKYKTIQQYALRACSKQVVSSPTQMTFEPIVMVDGRWAIDSLRDDTNTVSRLIVEVLQFNLAPVFLEDAFRSTPSDTPPQSASR